jgi:hypothetical protein
MVFAFSPNAATGIIISKTTRNGLKNFILNLLVYGQLVGYGLVIQEFDGQGLMAPILFRSSPAHFTADL